MHIAAAFEVPTVAVFGPTDWRTTAPFGGQFRLVRKDVACAPCLLRECPIDHRCMTGVTVDEVYNAASDQLGREGSMPAVGAVQESYDCERSDPSHPLAGFTVFLDRDGTLNEDSGFVKAPDELRLLPGVPEALARLQQAGARLVVLTNQSGVGRGFFSLRDLELIHARLRELLGRMHVQLDAIYFCPHHPSEDCPCRKPKRGMVDRAVAERRIDLSRSYLVGDQARDIEMAHLAGIRSVLVTTGPAGRQPLLELESKGLEPRCTVASLAEAAEWILEDAVDAGRGSPALQLTPRDQ
jgi:heptosyltransferase-2